MNNPTTAAAAAVRVDTPEQREADRLAKIADALEAEAERMHEHASGLYGRFAGGQPLLVGHHSYGSAVRDRDRADNATRRAIEKSDEAKRARTRANGAQAVADLAAIEATRTREWNRSDFKPGDVVKVRDFRRDMAVTSVYAVKRANAKTLTLDGGGVAGTTRSGSTRGFCPAPAMASRSPIRASSTPTTETREGGDLPPGCPSQTGAPAGDHAPDSLLVDQFADAVELLLR
ncbi:DUF3560 domain-containing protein [Streptomyces sp. NPDC102405]|uniref:DUF3560 domain-containing protein n=1 Tax=Streptomyces sp. NPDC102405 TaxID=3366170 RepID=UPI00382B7A7A